MSKIFPIVFVIVGLYMLIIGLRGIITKKPFVFSSKSNFWLLAVFFSPGVIQSLYALWDMFSSRVEYDEGFEWSTALILLLPLLIYPAILAFTWRQMSGYTILGVTDDSFRQALYAVLKDLGLPFEERLSKMHLTTLGADLEANVTGWMGIANLRIKQPEHQEILERITNGLKHYFSNFQVRINMVTCVYYIIFGVLVITSAVVFAGFF